jgi:mono/diheme cytochrome c family protein
LVLLAFVSFGSMEFVREGVRKPYIIEGFMYSTGVTTPEYKKLEKQRRANLETTTRDGVLSAAPWALPPGVGEEELDKAGRGQAVFKAACLRCHSVDGYNAIRPLIAGRSDQLLRTVLDDPEAHAAMPPFPGTEKEKRALIEYLRRLSAGQSE